MGLEDKIKAKFAHEMETYRISQEHVRKVAEQTPFPPFRQRIRMTDAQIEQWRRGQRRK